MPILNVWLSSLLFAVVALARVAPEVRRNTCNVDACSNALLQNAEAAGSFCKAFGKTVKRHAIQDPAETCAPATFLPYPEFASPCFEDGQDLSRVSASCDCLTHGFPHPSPVGAGLGHSPAAAHQDTPVGLHGGSSSGQTSTLDVVTTEM